MVVSDIIHIFISLNLILKEMKKSGAIICCVCGLIVIAVVIYKPEVLFFIGAIGTGFLFMIGINRSKSEVEESQIND